jgi:SAM-dependent methyltransferase
MTATPIPPIRQTSAAAERNKAPILAVLQRVVPATGAALEIAAGTGQHAAHFAAHLPGWTWQPTDPDTAALASIAAWRAQALADAPGLLAPLPLDVLAEPWPVSGPFDAIYCANMLHIAPWACCGALMRQAARLLAPEGRLITYGPYFVDDEAPAPGNLAFDADLRQRNPAWGVRALSAVAGAASAEGLRLLERVAMPANNLVLVFGHAAPAGR